MGKMLTPALCLLAIASLPAAAVAVERGVWFYSIPTEYYGAANIIGNPAREDETIAFMQSWHIDRVYGSYGTLSTDEPDAIANWNRKLALAGIDSYVEISGATRSFPENRDALLSTVDDRLVNFNAARSDPLERFVGIEMDIEPWTTDEWAARTTTQRRDMLFDLRDAYAAVRQRATAGGQPAALLSAALPIFFDTTSTIAWSSPAEISQWFTDIGSSLNEMSPMPYGTNSVSTILSRVSYERAHFPGTTYTALRTRTDLEWASMDQFESAMTSIESQTGQGIDIENYYRLRNLLPEPSLLLLAPLALLRRPRARG